jgi:hypothetical protein
MRQTFGVIYHGDELDVPGNQPQLCVEAEN